MRTWRLPFLVASLALALVSANGAAARQQTSASRWADTFCGAIQTWEGTIKKGAPTLSTTIAKAVSAGNLKGARSKVVGYLQGTVAATKKMRDTVNRAGAPAVPNGAHLQQAVYTAFGTVVSFFQKAVSNAEKLPISSTGAFASAAIKLGKDISAGSSQIAAAFDALDKYNSATLTKALRASKACKAIGIS